jgi:3-oxoisoapionate kinase
VTPIVFIGDDFTGSTDALESYTRLGRSVRLVTGPDRLAEVLTTRQVDVVGLATTTRAQSPEAMTRTLSPLFRKCESIGISRVHYKCCSTFDSAPLVGSIGRVIDLAADTFGGAAVPIIGATPALGRYCVFGNLFARHSDGHRYRIDRHPSMSKHPTTPMNEADLRVHLSKQTSKVIHLIDLISLRSGGIALDPGVTLVDGLDESDLALASQLVQSSEARFVVGGSGACSVAAGLHDCGRERIASAAALSPLLVVAGSCSPATMAQLMHARSHGFAEAIVRSDDDVAAGIEIASCAFARAQSIVIHTDSSTPLIGDANTPLGRVLDATLQRSSFAAVLLCGGDTSGTLAGLLGVTSIEMIASTVRGVPLCRVSSDRPTVDGRLFLFKGGQIGPRTLFTDIRDGTNS